MKMHYEGEKLDSVCKSQEALDGLQFSKHAIAGRCPTDHNNFSFPAVTRLVIRG